MTQADRDRYAAIDAAGWLLALEQCRDSRGAVCKRCGKWKRKRKQHEFCENSCVYCGTTRQKYHAGQYNCECWACSGRGHALPPDLVGTCMVFSDWLEERGDPRAELVRPSKDAGKVVYFAENERWGWGWLPSMACEPQAVTQQTLAKILLLLFCRECERCKGKGSYWFSLSEDEEGRDLQCPDCSGLGYLPLPIPVFVRRERCGKCDGDGKWKTPGNVIRGNCPACHGSGSVVPSVAVPEEVAGPTVTWLQVKKWKPDGFPDPAGFVISIASEAVWQWARWRVRLV